jgi:HD-GYP domain-containing protein (c-di-GMP phosphodiesterase class II)
MKSRRIPLEYRVPLIYLIFGVLWILASDLFLESIITNPHELTNFQTYKGWFFVLASALIIYFLLKAGLSVRRRLFEESQRRLERIETLHEIDQAISSNHQLEKTLDILVSQVRRHLKVDGAAVLLYDRANKLFRCESATGFQTIDITGMTVNYEGSLAGIAAESGQIIRLKDFRDKADENLRHFLAQENIQEYLAIPLMAKNNLTGILELFHRSPMEPDEEWLNYYRTLAGQAAVAIENAQLVQELQTANKELTGAYEATIEGWSRAMDLRDRETEGHTLRVTQMTLDLARRMNIPEEALVHIRHGALLHDIGKIGIPDSILLKPDSLTKEERAIIERHPGYAYELLRSVDYLRPALEIPHLHHEKWDGSGYPYGLAGEQIPLAARLFAVVDVYDALTSERPYRPAWSEKDAIAYIQEQSGKHFDPEVVRVFLEYLRSREGEE